MKGEVLLTAPDVRVRTSRNGWKDLWPSTITNWRPESSLVEVVHEINEGIPDRNLDDPIPSLNTHSPLIQASSVKEDKQAPPLSAIARVILEDNEKAFVHTVYLVQAEIVHDKPIDFSAASVAPDEETSSEPLEFTILLHASEYIELLTERQKRLHIQITILPSEKRYTAYVGINFGRFYDFPLRLTPNDVEELNRELQTAVEQVATVREGRVLDNNELVHLAYKGTYAFKRIFTEGGLREIIRPALRSGATIQVVTRDFTIPWELLYDGPLDDSVDVACFWGMRYIVSRSLIQDTHPGNLVEPDEPDIRSERPRVGLITYNRLEHVLDKEIPMLQRLDREKRISLVSLRVLNAHQRHEGLAYVDHFLRDEKLHIVHFACHAHERKPTSQSYLLVSDDFAISIEDFRVREFLIKDHPLLILNACLTGTISPLYTSNWAALFWERGARGVLATEFHVPDQFAAAFTEEFYHHFLSGTLLGEALLATRHHFWKEHGNPLGLAYALYSSPTIRIMSLNSEIGTDKTSISTAIE